ncbi:MAG: redox-sensing transcriptional repressor Rex [Oscillospiraceae bacterium]|nr:redox-sensing transcriptional repressor Rex [Oscillospiraceae bacterium]
MKRIKISNNVIRRLPKYLRKLDDLTAAGVERISSGELGRQMGLTPSQIRQDFSCFGEFGQQGYGYNVVALRQEIAKILGMDRNFSCMLVGVGNIGHALISHFNFDNFGFNLLGAFDVKSDLIGANIKGVPVYDIKELRIKLNELQPDAAILCLPSFYANEVAPVLVECGVRGIWNFTNVELDVPGSTTVIENIYFSDSLLALGYYLSEYLDEQAAKEAKQRK